MKYNITIFTEQQAWQFIKGRYFRYYNYLRNLGYDYNMFIPNFKPIKDMFENETYFQRMKNNKFCEEDLLGIKKDFFSFYSEEHFEESIKYFKEKVIPQVDKELIKLQVLKDNWGMYIPDELNIAFTYGIGGCYYFNNPLVSKFITVDAIIEDLPKAVKELSENLNLGENQNI